MGFSGGFKIFFIMLFLATVFPFISDASALLYVQRVGGERMEMAIDIGIIEAEYDIDATNGGIVKLDTTVLKDAVKASFAKQMHLNTSMENKSLTHSTFNVDLVYDADERPFIEATFSTNMRFMVPGWDHPVLVARRIPYETIFN